MKQVQQTKLENYFKKLSIECNDDSEQRLKNRQLFNNFKNMVTEKFQTLINDNIIYIGDILNLTGSIYQFSIIFKKNSIYKKVLTFMINISHPEIYFTGDNNWTFMENSKYVSKNNIYKRGNGWYILIGGEEEKFTDENLIRIWKRCCF